MKRLFLSLFLGGVLGLCACCTERSQVAKGTQCTVPFRELTNYFIRTDAPKERFVKVFFSQEEFHSIFGMAAFMGPNGRPSKVDFEHEVVIAVAMPPRNQACTLRVTEVVKEEGGLVFHYTQTLGEPLTYTIRPNLLIAIAKSDIKSNISFLYVNESERP